MLLNPDEVRLLGRGLFGSPTDRASVLLEALLPSTIRFSGTAEKARIESVLDADPPSLASGEFAWLVFKTEFEFVSDVLGAGVEWPTIMGGRDYDGLRTLLALRGKLTLLIQEDAALAAELRASAARLPPRRFEIVYPSPRIRRIFPDGGREALELDPLEQKVLRGGLGDFWADRNLSAAAAVVLFGDADARETLVWTRGVRELIGPRTALVPGDWLRVQVCVELAFGSSLVGIADRWADEVEAEFLTLQTLRGLQRKIVSIRAALRPSPEA